MLQSWEWGRGKFDFDQLSEKIELFAWLHLFRLVETREDQFQNKIVQNGPSLQILENWAQKYLIYFWQKKWSFVC